MKKPNLPSLLFRRTGRKAASFLPNVAISDFVVLVPSPEIELRPLGESDAHPLFDLIDRNRQYLREWLPWLDSQQNSRDSLLFIQSISLQHHRNENLTVGIWYQKQLCGIISYNRFDWPNRSSMIGYWLAQDFQGKGIMTKACEAFIEYGFSQLHLHRIEIRCATGNRKSCAIPGRLGFHNEGCLRDGEWLYDHYVDLNVYAMLAGDWKSSRGGSE